MEDVGSCIKKPQDDKPRDEEKLKASQFSIFSYSFIFFKSIVNLISNTVAIFVFVFILYLWVIPCQMDQNFKV